MNIIDDASCKRGVVVGPSDGQRRLCTWMNGGFEMLISRHLEAEGREGGIDALVGDGRDTVVVIGVGCCGGKDGGAVDQQFRWEEDVVAVDCCADGGEGCLFVAEEDLVRGFMPCKGGKQFFLTAQGAGNGACVTAQFTRVWFAR